jgi:hypothetical protein
MRRITGHLKLSIFIFIFALLGTGSIVAEESSASSSRTAVTADAGFNFDYGNNQIAGRAIDERLVDRYISFEPSEAEGSSRYSMSLDLEHEADDWNFEITVTIEF